MHLLNLGDFGTLFQMYPNPQKAYMKRIRLSGIMKLETLPCYEIISMWKQSLPGGIFLVTEPLNHYILQNLR